MIDAFFSETLVVGYTLSGLKDAGFIHWYIMSMRGKSFARAQKSA